MNEETQLKAIAAELAAQGFEIRRDVAGGELAELGFRASAFEDLTLDIVGTRKFPVLGPDERLQVSVVEVANRTRRAPAFADDTLKRPVRMPYDEEALARFETISAAVAGHPFAYFEIRFLDVSAEQAAARRLTARVNSKAAMSLKVLEDTRLLGISEVRDPLSRVLVIARLWAYWLRAFAHKYPGKAHAELQDADLRILQKDLYDSEVLKMNPERYARVHQALQAIFEGGDLRPAALLGLEDDLRRLLNHAAEIYDAELPPEPLDALRATIGAISRELDQRAESSDIADARAALILLAVRARGPRFAADLAGFQLAVRGRNIVSEDLIVQLLEAASAGPDEAGDADEQPL